MYINELVRIFSIWEITFALASNCSLLIPAQCWRDSEIRQKCHSLEMVWRRRCFTKTCRIKWKDMYWMMRIPDSSATQIQNISRQSAVYFKGWNLEDLFLEKLSNQKQNTIEKLDNPEVQHSNWWAFSVYTEIQRVFPRLTLKYRLEFEKIYNTKIETKIYKWKRKFKKYQ